MPGPADKSIPVFDATQDEYLPGVAPIQGGGTGQVTANAAFNALAPSQGSNAGKFLTTDGTNTSWATASGGGAVLGDSQTVALEASTASNTFTDLVDPLTENPSPGPAVTLTFSAPTKVLITLSWNQPSDDPDLTGHTGRMGVAVSGATTIAPDTNNAAQLTTYNSNGVISVCKQLVLSVNTGQNTFTAKYVNDFSANTYAFKDRTISVIALTGPS